MENSTKTFDDLLLEYSTSNDIERRQRIDDELWEVYGKTTSVLVVDMSGFKRISEAYGLVHFLSMVRRMQATAGACIPNYSGRIVKFEADNVFAKFESPVNAIRAAIGLNVAFAAVNLVTPPELDIHISCGIDHGPCLVPSQTDFFGVPLNRASFLGEDAGEPDEILVTDTAMQLVPSDLDIRTEVKENVLPGTVVHSVLFSSTQ